MKKCPKCDIAHIKEGKFCSRICANSRGPRSESFKIKVREKLTGRKRPQISERMSGDNHPKRRGKNLPPIQIKECLQCNNTFKTNGNSKFCSRICWQENTKMQRTAWENYKQACAFKFNVYDFPRRFDISLIEQHGWYKASNRGNNLNGISRDHMISVRYGFENAINPKIISHPANCKLVHHVENQKKRAKCTITLQELINEISKFESQWRNGNASGCNPEGPGSIPG